MGKTKNTLKETERFGQNSVNLEKENKILKNYLSLLLLVLPRWTDLISLQIEKLQIILGKEDINHLEVHKEIVKIPRNS